MKSDYDSEKYVPLKCAGEALFSRLQRKVVTFVQLCFRNRYKLSLESPYTWGSCVPNVCKSYFTNSKNTLYKTVECGLLSFHSRSNSTNTYYLYVKMSDIYWHLTYYLFIAFNRETGQCEQRTYTRIRLKIWALMKLDTTPAPWFPHATGFKKRDNFFCWAPMGSYSAHNLGTVMYTIP